MIIQRQICRSFQGMLYQHKTALRLCGDHTTNLRLIAVCRITTNSFNVKRFPHLSSAMLKKSDGTSSVKESQGESHTNSRRKKKQNLDLICKTFDLSEDRAKKLAIAHPSLQEELLPNSLKFLNKLGLTKTMFIRYPWLITIPPMDIETKLRTIRETYQDLGDVNICAPLLKLPVEKLTDFIRTLKEEAESTEYSSKYHYLEQTLEVPLSDIMYMVHLRPFLLTISYKTLKERVTLCLEAGMSEQELIKDFSVIRASTVKLKSRIETLQRENVTFKPWILYTPQPSFESYLDDCRKNRSDMEEHPNIKSFLAARLNCEVNQIEEMINKHPGVKKVSAAKLKAILDYLLIEKGIDPKMIVMRPEVFRHSLETVKDRIQRLEALGVKFLSLWILSCRDQVFEDYVRRWGHEEQKPEE